MNIKHWVAAARLRTLPLSVSGIIVGCGMTKYRIYDASDAILLFFPKPKTDYTIFILALLTTIGFQVISNFANDYGDGVKGTDDERQGEKRLVASGVISPKKMKQAIVLASVITLIVAIVLLYVAFGKSNLMYSLLFFFLGIASIVAAIKYTVGRNAYGYSGFGDVFVFLFFGFLSTVGSYFLYTKDLDWEVFLPATSIGLLSVAVLNLNNMRDQIQDKKANKNTLVVKLGSQKAKIYHYALIIGALICAVIYVQLHYYSMWQYLFLVAFIPLILNIKTVAQNIIFSELDSELKKVALSTFLFAILFSIFN